MQLILFPHPPIPCETGDNITGMFEVDDWRGKRYGRRME